MKKFAASLIFALLISSVSLFAQEKVIKEVDGKVYYVHTIQEGEYLGKIAATYKVSQKEILQTNNISDPDKIRSGQKLLIPAKDIRIMPKSQTQAQAQTQTQTQTQAQPQPQQVEQKQEPVPVSTQKQVEEKKEEKELSWWEKIKEKNRKKKEGEEKEAETVKEPEVAIIDAPKEVKVEEKKDTMSLSLLLPFRSLSNNNSMAYNFYSGVLVALNNFGLEGYPIKVNVFDSSDQSDNITHEILESSDVILGPIDSREIKSIAFRIPDGQYVVSPLEPKAAGMTDSLRIIQAPLPASEQIRQMTRWACEDTVGADSLIVVKQKSATSNEPYGTVRRKINELGKACTIINCERYQDLKTDFSDFASKGGTTRFIIASYDEEFVKRVTSVIAGMAGSGLSVATYCPTVVRTFKKITNEDRAAANMRIVAGYYIEKESDEVKAFEDQYEQLFNGKPNAFAYQGFDLAHYFVNIYKLYGKGWTSHIEDYKESGLQTELDFARRSNIAGYVNEGARRTEYKINGDTRLVK